MFSCRLFILRQMIIAIRRFFNQQLYGKFISLLIVFSLLANTTPAAPTVIYASSLALGQNIRYAWLTSSTVAALGEFSLWETPIFAFFLKSGKKKQTVAKIEISPKNAVIREGEQIAMTAVALDAQGNVIQGVSFSWKAVDQRNNSPEKRKSPEIRLRNGFFEPANAGRFTITAESEGMTANTVLTVKSDVQHKTLKEFDQKDAAQAIGRNLNKPYSKAVAEEMARPRPAPFNNSTRMSLAEAKQLQSRLVPIEKRKAIPDTPQRPPLKKAQPMQKPGEEEEGGEEKSEESKTTGKSGPKVSEAEEVSGSSGQPTAKTNNFWVTGQLDGVTGTTLTGCAYDTNYGYPSIELYLDGDIYSGTYLGTAYTGNYNPSCYPGNAGFQYQIPTQYHDGQQHSISAYVWDIDNFYYVELNSSPAYFQIGSGGGGSGNNSNWGNGNYPTSDDPGLQPGNPSNTGTDGAGSSNFSFSAPVLSLGGRGMDVNLSLNYNSLLWHKAGTDINYDIDKGFPAPGWNIGFGKMMDMGSTGGAMLEDLDGTRHSYEGTVQQGYGGYATYYGKTTDGSFIDYRAYRSPSGMTGGAAYLANGTQITYGAAFNGVAYPTFIRDRHGNYLTIAYQNNQGPRITVITDNLNRSITFNYDGLNRLVSITGPGFNGTTRTFVQLHYTQQTLSYGFSGLSAQVRDNNPYQIDAIYYPGTNTGYWFGDGNSYSSYGMIAKVSARRGMSCPGCTTTNQGTITAGTMTKEMIYNYPLTANPNLTDAPQYTSMTEDWFGRETDNPFAPTITPVATTQYNIVNNPPAGQPRTTTITLPNQNRIVQYSINNPNVWNDGLLYKIETLPPIGNNTPLSKSETDWQPGDYNSARVTEIRSTDEKGQTTKQTFAYDPANPNYNQVAAVSEFGYQVNGNYPLLRTKVNTYENGGGYRGSYMNVNGQNIWGWGRHIFSLVKTEELFDANNVRLSKNDYVYDTATLMDTPGVAMYDQTFNPHNPNTYQGGCLQWEWDPWSYDYYCVEYEQIPEFDSTTLARGNVTQTITYENAAVPTGGIVYDFSYDITGNQRTATTDCCQQMQFIYSIETQYSQPDVHTKGSPTNPAQQNTESAVYDPNTGAVITSTDFNGLKTTVTYDAVLRPVEVTFPYTTSPNQGKKITAYDDANLVVTQTVTEANNNIVSQGQSFANGRGQTIKSKSLAGGSWNEAVVKYDEMGRQKYASMPYQTGGSPTSWTRYNYDLLSRVTQVTAPDGSTSTTFYNELNNKPSSALTDVGQTVRSQDAWGRERWARTDAFGRLEEVVEPKPDGNGGVTEAGNMVTRYSYSPKDELVQVNQLDPVTQFSQLRAFKYDSLGRLTRQKLAEQTGTIDNAGNYVNGKTDGWSDAFFYDNKSNLIRRTDARGVKTNFVYNNDPLNRLWEINYDKTGAVNDPNNPIQDASPVNLTYEADPTKDKTRVKTSSTWYVQEENNYDALGRISEYKVIYAQQGGQPFVTRYYYDTASRLSEIWYPASYGMAGNLSKIVKPSYDNASRLNDLKVDNQIQMSEILYNPLSQVTQLKTGAATGNADVEQYAYDAQTGLLTNQQVFKANNPATVLLNLSYDYQKGNSNGSLNGKTGQLTKITDNLNQNKNRIFEFDTLGRLKTAKGGAAAGGVQVGSAPPVTANWTQTYGYDRYGNRLAVNASGVTQNNQTVPTDGWASMTYDNSSNRINIAGYQYDLAGNLSRGQSPDGVWQKYEYDCAGRLMTVKRESDNWIQQNNGYGASRQRVVSWSYASSLLTWYVWGGSSVLAEYTAPSWQGAYSWAKSYIYAGSRLLSTFTKDGGGEKLEYQHPDRLGTRLVTNNTANTSFEQNTLPFGTALDGESTGATNQRFTLYDRSTVAQLDYAQNRSYSYGQGRFTQVDPIGFGASGLANPQSLNLYSYTQNNPVDYTDPTGLNRAAPGSGGGQRGMLYTLYYGNNNDGWTAMFSWFVPYGDGGDGEESGGGGDVAGQVRTDIDNYLATNPGCADFITDFASKLFPSLNPATALDLLLHGLNIVDATTSNPNLFKMRLNDIGIPLDDMVTRENYEFFVGGNNPVSARGTKEGVYIYDSYFADKNRSTSAGRGATAFHELIHTFFGTHSEVATALTNWNYPIPPKPPGYFLSDETWENRYRVQHRNEIDQSAFNAMEKWIEDGCPKK